jgi:hypothetical protein
MTFKINNQDITNALLYLGKKLNNDTTYLMHLNDLQKEKVAKNELHNSDSDDLLALWCKTYLTDSQFSALRASLRKKSSRTLKPTINLEINKDVYNKLNDLSAQSDMNVKDYLVKLINDKYKDINLWISG